MKKTKTILISLLILLASIAITVIIMMTEPTAQKSGATKETAMLVETTTVVRDTFRPIFKATGQVRSPQEVLLRPRVTGPVINLSPNFVPGSIVKKGERLLQIDPSDYENALAMRESELLQAEADLNIEKGQQAVARRDFELVDDSLQNMNRSLVLREPQLQSAEATYQAAKTAVQQAELNLDRTVITAPFDAQVLSRNAFTGSQLSPSDPIGRLVSIDEYWVMVNLPSSNVKWLNIGENQGEKGSDVILKNPQSWQKNESRAGTLKKMIGALEDRTRMARLIVSVPDPLGRKGHSTQTPLIINSFLEAYLHGKECPDVVRLKRDDLRKNNTCWVKEEGRLSIRELEILVKDHRYAYVSRGLNDGDSVVTSKLATVADGAKLRTETTTDHSTQDSLQEQQ